MPFRYRHPFNALILISLRHATGHPSVQIFKRLMTKNQLFSGQIKKSRVSRDFKGTKKVEQKFKQKNYERSVKITSTRLTIIS